MSETTTKMVNANRGLPDPPNASDDNVSPNEEIIMGTDTETDDEDNDFNGYEPLPLGPEYVNESSDNEMTEEDSNIPTLNNDVPLIPIRNEIGNLWSSTASSSVDIEMDSSKVDEVKEAMLNVTLPGSSIPDWAKNVPEELWKQHIMDRLQHIKNPESS